MTKNQKQRLKIDNNLTLHSESEDMHSQFQMCHSELEQTISILKQNIDRVIERGELLETLSQRSETLSINSQHFKKRIRKLRLKMWWENTKLKLYTIGIATAAIATGTYTLAFL